MKLFLLGATGRTGKWVLQEALKRNHEVVCLSRNVERLGKHVNLIVIEGSPTKLEDVEKAIAGCDVIVSVLNVSRKSDFPWARLRTPPTFLSDTINNLIQTVEPSKRIVICSAWGVAETKKDLPSWFRWFIDNSNIGVAYKDHERQEQLLEKSKLDWTFVRPVGLTNGRRKKVQESFNNEPRPSLLISRKSVANYLLDCLEKPELIHKKIVISNR